MIIRLLLVLAAVLVGAAAVAQLQITTFNTSGELSWTNSIYRGLYCVESTCSGSNSWTPLTSAVDLDGSRTNQITLHVALTNRHKIYRVAWIPPNPIGLWDYRGYDNQGMLVSTGQLSLFSKSLLTSNPPVVYGLQGSWNLQYAGPPTNELWHLGPQIGEGELTGTIEIQTAFLRLQWPTNEWDGRISLFGDVWLNSYTGRWTYVTAVGPQTGTFRAARVNSTNLINNNR